MYQPYQMYPSFQTTSIFPSPFMGAAQQAQPQQSQGIIGVTEVHGYQGAMDAQVPMGATAMLMDDSDPVFYIKQVNNQGIATINRFRFQPWDQDQEQRENFVTRQEFEELKGKLNESISQQPGSTTGATAEQTVQYGGSTELRQEQQPDSTVSTANGTGQIEQW